MTASKVIPGTMVGARYRLERFLGEGGMGTVWAAEDTTTGQRCALKLMKDAPDEPDARKRFLREGRATLAVRHPNVIRIFDVIEPAGEPPAIVMELLEGESLREMLARDHVLAPEVLADVMAPVISAVGAAHALGIVHRDLKPENIFLAREPGVDRTVKVLDFGIAKLTALDGAAMRSTGITTGAVLGTPAYMAPEQVFAERDLDHRADIWALGVIFYECLAGACPTAGDNVGQVLKHVVSKPFARLREVVPGISEPLSDVIARMLERDRAHRPADLREVMQVLQPLARTPGIPFEAPVPYAVTAPFAPPEFQRDEPRRQASAGSAATEPALAVKPRVKPTEPALTVAPHRQRLAVPGAIAAAVAVGAIITWWAWPGQPISAGPGANAPSPLSASAARLACPILVATGVDPPAGWLGAAAAATACERARVLLGGRPERTLAPAELLDLPHEPRDSFPADRYGAGDARERSISAARQRAHAYLDGEVTWSNASFTVELSLRRPDGSEIRRGAGHARGLYKAVRAAMEPLIGSDSLPRAGQLEPDVAGWARTSNIDDALAVTDLAFAFAHNAGDLPDECRRFAQLSARVRELGVEGNWLCAYTLGQALPDEKLDESDRSPAAVATRIRVAHVIYHRSDAADRATLRGMFEHETTPRGRSLLAASESCLIGSSDAEAARERAIAAVQNEPKNIDGGLCSPWEQLVALERGAGNADGAWHAMQAWAPWNSRAWLEEGFHPGGQDTAALPRLQRAYVLSPFDAEIAGELAAAQLAAGDRTAARTIAMALRQGGLPLHELESRLLLVQVDASEARFAAALDQARSDVVLAADTGWMRTQRFELAWRALEVAMILGRGGQVADWIVAQFIEADPIVLDPHTALITMRVPAVCAQSSQPRRCFARFRALRPRLPGAATQQSDDFLAGAERYVQHDLPGAAQIWRKLLRGGMAMASALPDAVVDTFEQTGATDLAELVDTEVMKRAAQFHGATLGHVRAARRAFQRGDRKLARRLATEVIQAWSLADEEPPALNEMRQLVGRL